VLLVRDVALVGAGLALAYLVIRLIVPGLAWLLPLIGKDLLP